jgi:hypothetical protein
VKVTNVSLSATVQDIKEFFSFSGDIEHVDMQRFANLECARNRIILLLLLQIGLLVSFTDFSSHVFFSLDSGDEWSQVAYVTFKDAQGAETALLLSVSNLRLSYDSVFQLNGYYFLSFNCSSFFNH